MNQITVQRKSIFSYSEVGFMLYIGELMAKIALHKKISLFCITLLSLTIAYLDFLSPAEVPIDALYAIPIWLGLLTFKLTGGLIVATTSILLFYISNFLPIGTKSDHVLLSVFLTYSFLLLFGLIAHRYLLNQRKLAEARIVLQTRLKELDKLNQQAQTLHEQNLKLAVVGERNRIAREIHDVLAQGFTGIILQVEAAHVHRNDPVELEERLAQIDQLARYNLQEARRSVAGLRPLPLDGSTLLGALEQKVNDFRTKQQIEANFSTSGEVQHLSPEIEDTLYRIGQESLTNVGRHSGATAVQVVLDYDEDEVCLTVQDNGRGFELPSGKSDKNGQSFGLSMMQERARLVGGWVTIQSKLNEGCRIRVIIPYNRSQDLRQLATMSENVP
ncbi:MAG: sensor histidine kinase [Chloroflexi bacterium]|nr:sensor histidine kinase [Chloroflexota bacterium]